MGVAQNQRTLRQRKVKKLVAIDVPDAVAFAAFVEQRVRLVEFAEFAGNSAREDLARALV
jgi:hypothetical protein